jgi:hypothetical protein
MSIYIWLVTWSHVGFDQSIDVQVFLPAVSDSPYTVLAFTLPHLSSLVIVTT